MEKISTIRNNIIKITLQIPQSTPNDAITIKTGTIDVPTLTDIKQINNHMRISKMVQERQIKTTWEKSKKMAATYKQHERKIHDRQYRKQQHE